MLRGKWWEIYQDPQLNQLEDRIAANNQSLRQALETYLAARDQVTAARAASLSQRSPVTLRQPRPGLRKSAPGYAAGKPNRYNDLVIGGQASWEPDFWGRIRRTVEAARENAQANAADTANIDLSLHAEMAADYFQFRGLDAADQTAQRPPSPISKTSSTSPSAVSPAESATEADVAQARPSLKPSARNS